MPWLMSILLAIGGLNAWLGYLIRYRHEYGLIAGYDMRRVPDPERLARWLGGWGIVLGLACMTAAIAASTAPQYIGPILRVMAAVILLSVMLAVGGSISRAR